MRREHADLTADSRGAASKLLAALQAHLVVPEEDPRSRDRAQRHKQQDDRPWQRWQPLHSVGEVCQLRSTQC